MENCIFCKIIKGEIPCTKIYEDSKVLAFLDIGPVNKGHTLVVPKEHHETLLDMPDDLLAGVAKATKKIAKAVKEGMKVNGFNVLQSNYRVSGQIVPHYHVHIIPRLETDGLKHWSQGKYGDGEAEGTAEKIKKAL
ncbi:HIT family protein [Candidatus Woesearchaeota archaeon]|nr:HIT family protein [Candidatus Woesearchaeota archaeon]